MVYIMIIIIEHYDDEIEEEKFNHLPRFLLNILVL